MANGQGRGKKGFFLAIGGEGGVPKSSSSTSPTEGGEGKCKVFFETNKGRGMTSPVLKKGVWDYIQERGEGGGPSDSVVWRDERRKRKRACHHLEKKTSSALYRRRPIEEKGRKTASLYGKKGEERRPLPGGQQRSQRMRRKKKNLKPATLIKEKNLFRRTEKKRDRAARPP